MNVSTVDKNVIIIRLTDEEISSMFGGYHKISYQSRDSKEKLNSLINNIIKSSEFPLDCDSLMIEVKRESMGCSIILTKLYHKAPNRYKKLILKTRISEFDCTENMIKGISDLYNSHLKIKKSDLYLVDKKYYLIIYSAVTDASLKEYCQSFTANANDLSYIEEYGTALCLGDAVHIIGKYFKN